MYHIGAGHTWPSTFWNRRKVYSPAGHRCQVWLSPRHQQAVLQRRQKQTKTNCYTFGEFYRSDVNAQDLYEEILDCQLLLSRRVDQKVSRHKELRKFIVEYGDGSVFPNLCVTIQIMLTIAVSITGCERSFSKLKLILSYLRATMGQDRISDLALLSVERETEKMNFDVIIEQFASSRARKVLL